MVNTVQGPLVSLFFVQHTGVPTHTRVPRRALHTPRYNWLPQVSPRAWAALAYQPTYPHAIEAHLSEAVRARAPLPWPPPPCHSSNSSGRRLRLHPIGGFVQTYTSAQQASMRSARGAHRVDRPRPMQSIIADPAISTNKRGRGHNVRFRIFCSISIRLCGRPFVTRRSKRIFQLKWLCDISSTHQWLQLQHSLPPMTPKFRDCWA